MEAHLLQDHDTLGGLLEIVELHEDTTTLLKRNAPVKVDILYKS